MRKNTQASFINSVRDSELTPFNSLDHIFFLLCSWLSCISWHSLSCIIFNTFFRSAWDNWGLAGAGAQQGTWGGKNFTQSGKCKLVSCRVGGNVRKSGWKTLKGKYQRLHLFPLQMRKALKEQQEVSLHLKSYIDRVLLNIMERYPELLEVSSSSRWASENIMRFWKWLWYYA